MAFVPNDASTFKANQLRRYEQAAEDLRRHERKHTLQLVLLLIAVIALTAGGLLLFHLLR